MKQSTQPAPARRRPRSVKRTILLVLLGLLLVAVALLAIRIYRTATAPQIFACGAIAVPFRRRRHRPDTFSILTDSTAQSVLSDEFILPEIPQERRQ